MITGASIADIGPSSKQGLCELIAGNINEETHAFISERLFTHASNVGISSD